MRITCPTCSAQYDVDSNDISFTGQEVQCSECLTVWTQSRSGVVDNPQQKDALVDEAAEEIAPRAPEPVEEPAVSEWDTIAALAEETQEDAAEVEEAVETPEPDETPDEAPFIPDAPEPLVVQDEVEDVEEADEKPEPEEISSAEETTEDRIEEDAVEVDLDEPEEPLEESEQDNPEYTPPTDIPPIQDKPATSDEPQPDLDEEEERPWEIAAVEDEEEELTDFVWATPTEDKEPDETPLAEPSFTQFEDSTDSDLDEIDDDILSAALNEQMAIEDALEDESSNGAMPIEAIPEELGGRRTSAPNLDALKSSVRSKSVNMTKEERKEAKPARRFRFGFILVIFLFAVLSLVYVMRETIGASVPALQPYLETFAVYVDILRGLAESLIDATWGLIQQAFDWVMSKISG